MSEHRMRRIHYNKRKREFYREVKDIVEHPVVQSMKQYPHHGKTNCYKHCLRVAYFNYCLCSLLGFDARSAARAGMLHDLFLYDWHTHAELTGERLHGLKHPEKAYYNAKKHFELNEVEKDVIRTHMWPVTLRAIPKTKEGWVTTFTDKYSGLLETGRRK